MEVIQCRDGKVRGVVAQGHCVGLHATQTGSLGGGGEGGEGVGGRELLRVKS